jgi:hypothetical protein
MSDPDVEHARAGMAKLEHMVVQDIFLTETAYLADVVLPATAWPEKVGTVTNTDRMVQLGRKAVEPPGEAREDFWILVELGRRLGLDWKYTHPKDVFDEMRGCMDSIKGITWERLERDSSVTYPCENEGDPGQPVVFTEVFPTPTGRAKFVPADLIPAAERPDAEYPMVLITGRQLEHWLGECASARRDRAGADRIAPSRRPARARREARRGGHGRVAPRQDLALRARRRRHASRRGVHSVRVLRGGGEHAHQPGARPVRQDPGVQVLRRQGDERRRAARKSRLRQGPLAYGNLRLSGRAAAHADAIVGPACR